MTSTDSSSLSSVLGQVEMAKGVKIDIRGLQELRDALDKNSTGLEVALGKALYSAAEDIAAESKQLVPFDNGDLSASQSIEPSSVAGLKQKTPEIEIAYGTPYALVQHERLDFWHPPRPPGNSRGRTGAGPVAPGQPQSPKYLEFPFIQETNRYPELLVERIRQHYHIDTMGANQ